MHIADIICHGQGAARDRLSRTDPLHPRLDLRSGAQTPFQRRINKGEARNALASALFFHRHGEIRDRTFENQRYRASGLNLTIAAIIWNTIYLGHAVAELRAQAETLPDKLLAHIAPLGWEHISFNGDYVWPSEPFKHGFRPLRNPRSPSSMPLSVRFGTDSAMTPDGWLAAYAQSP